MNSLIVKVGCHVELELSDNSGVVDRLSVDIVSDRSADFKAGFLGESTPLARTILDQPAGRTVQYRVGDLQTVRILSVSPSQAQADENAAARRQEAIQRAVAESDRTNAILFASSFSGKWGDYDPQGIEQWNKDEEDKKAGV